MVPGDDEATEALHWGTVSQDYLKYRPGVSR
jgi:hypothetical protein